MLVKYSENEKDATDSVKLNEFCLKNSVAFPTISRAISAKAGNKHIFNVSFKIQHPITRAEETWVVTGAPSKQHACNQVAALVYSLIEKSVPEPVVKEEKQPKEDCSNCKFLLEMLDMVLEFSDGFGEACQKSRNKLMHSQNGNIEGKPKVNKGKPRKKTGKKVQKKKFFGPRKPPGFNLNSAVQSRASEESTGEQKYSRNLAYSVAIPKFASKERWSTGYDAQPTAQVVLEDMKDAAYNTNDTGGTMLDASTMLMFRSKNPCRAFIQYDPNSAAKKSTYKFFQGGNTSAPSATFTDDTPQISQVYDFDGLQDDERVIKLVYGTENTTAVGTTPYPSEKAIHGAAIFAAQASEKPELRFIFLAKDEKVYFTISSVPATKTVLVNPYQYTYDKKVLKLVGPTMVAGSLTTAFVAEEPAYYAFTIEADDVFTANLTVNYANEGVATFGHFALPQLLNEISKIVEFRVNGASILVSNTSPIIDIQGNIAGGVVPKKKSWMKMAKWATGDNMITPIVALPDKFVGKASKGIYGFIKPSSEESFDYKAYWTVGPTGITDSKYPIEEEEDFLIVGIVVNQAEGRSFLVTMDTQLEFTTDSQWKETRIPNFSRNVVDAAMVALRNVPSWHENPTHFKDIANKIGSILKTVVNGIVKYGPGAINVAKTVGALL